MNRSIELYIDTTLDLIENELDLGDSGRKRIEEEMRAEIQDRLPNAVDLHDIENVFGSCETWAAEFVENSDFPKASFSSDYINYRSKTKIFGLPLVHITRGVKNGKKQIACGIFAAGDVALGVVAFGGFAAGGIAFGGFAAGVISIGGFALAVLYAIGGFSLGLIALGGFAVGFFAWGGFAAGHYALGGFACGHTIVGGMIYGITGIGGKAFVRNELAKSHWLWQLNLFLNSNALLFVLGLLFILNVIPIIAIILMLVMSKKAKRQKKLHENSSPD